MFGDVPPTLGHATGQEVIHLYDLTTHQLSMLPGSKGLWTSRWSPGGRYIAALTVDSQELMLFDFKTRKWSELARHWVHDPSWSRKGNYIYFDNHPSEDDPAILRARVLDGKIERVVSLQGFRRAYGTGTFGNWLGLAPDDAPLLVRDARNAEVYALDWQLP